MSGEVKKLGILGWPAHQSLSPLVHGYWLAQYGMQGQYDLLATAPDALEAQLRQVVQEGYHGINITKPHKETVMAFLDETDAVARAIGAVNTITIHEGKLFGTNTDAYGFIENLKQHHAPVDGKTLVLGAGGASRAVCAGLLGEGAEVILTNRTMEKAEKIARELSGTIEVVAWEELEKTLPSLALLVNTTSLGMSGQEPLRIKLDQLPAAAVVTDIVYSPLITPLLEMAQQKGNAIVDGLGMLLYQAQAGFETWFGIRPEVTGELRAQVVRAIA